MDPELDRLANGQPNHRPLSEAGQNSEPAVVDELEFTRADGAVSAICGVVDESPES
jgi:hypothetical protein